MYGNVLTNRQLRKLIESRTIIIEPFDAKRLKEASYTLTAGFVRRRGTDGDWDNITELKGKNKSLLLKPNEYVIVVVKQKVVFKEPGLVGNFITASNNVESGLLVVAGQIDSKYGEDGEGLHFGVKNLLDCDNSIDCDTRIVHLQVTDLRGSTADQVNLAKSQEDVWKDRRGPWSDTDDGPNYGLAKE